MFKCPLSKEQRRTVELLAKNPECSILVPSIAGSGKSSTIRAMGNYLVEEMKVDPSEIIFVTFTSSAAQHMRDSSKYEYRMIDTFHAMPGIVMGKMNILNLDEELYHCDVQLRQLAVFLQSNTKDSLAFRKSIKYLFIDEVQDNNTLMMAVAKAFHSAGTRIIGVGDLFQAIMGFQGASVKHMIQFQKTFAPCMISQLPVNYRCSTPIVKLARAIKERGKLYPELYSVQDQSFEESVWYENRIPLEEQVSKARKPRLIQYYKGDQMIEWSCQEIKRKLQWRKPHELVMLARNNDALLKCRAMLLKLGIPCILLKQVTRQSKSVLRKRKRDEKNGIAWSAESEIQQQMMEAEQKGKVVLSTIHSSKGLEWLDGVILEFHDLIFPSIKEPDLQNERNLAYVAITRFREDLSIYNCYPQTSTFLLELDRDGLIDDLFHNPSNSNFHNESCHLNTILLLDENDVDLENTIQLEKKNCEKLIQATNKWINNLNGCSYLHIREQLLPNPLSLEIKSIPLLYNMPLPDHLKLIKKPNHKRTSVGDVEEDDEKGDEDAIEEEIIIDEEDEKAVADEIDLGESDDGETEEDEEVEPHQHSQWIQRECLEDEISDFIECCMIRIIQQLKKDFNVKPEEKTKSEVEVATEYSFPPAETCYSEMQRKASHVEASKLQLMYTSYAKRYKNHNLHWNDCLLPIYWTSAFTGFQAGNVGLVYVRMTESKLLEYKFMLDEIMATLHYLLYGNKKWSCNATTHPNWSLQTFYHVTGNRKPQPFILVGDRLILWCNEASDFGAFPQDMVIKALVYAAIYRSVKNVSIKIVQIYHTFSRKICTVNIEGWPLLRQKEFLRYIQLVKRDQYIGFSSEDDDEKAVEISASTAPVTPPRKTTSPLTTERKSTSTSRRSAKRRKKLNSKGT
jgi:hypothetical protein